MPYFLKGFLNPDLPLVINHNILATTLPAPLGLVWELDSIPTIVCLCVYLSPFFSSQTPALVLCLLNGEAVFHGRHILYMQTCKNILAA